MARSEAEPTHGWMRLPRTRREWVAEGVDWLKSIAFVLAVFLPIMAFVVQGYRIPSGSMEDTLLIGDFLFADKITFGARIPLFSPARIPGLRKPQPGDVVIFKSPETGETLIKRVVAIGGQTIQLHRKDFFRDGVLIQEPYVKHIRSTYMPQFDDFGPYTVPAGNLFCLGDNRDASRDGRFFGPVPFELVIAKADVLYFSFDKRKLLPRLNRIGKLL